MGTASKIEKVQQPVPVAQAARGSNTLPAVHPLTQLKENNNEAILETKDQFTIVDGNFISQKKDNKFIPAVTKNIVQRKLNSYGQDRFYGTVTKEDYKFDIEPGYEKEYKGIDDEPVKVKFEERPVFVDITTKKHIPVVTLGIQEKEKIPDLFTQLGISTLTTSEGGALSSPGNIGDTSAARMGLVLNAYKDVILDKKAKFTAAGKWPDNLETLLVNLNNNIAEKSTMVAWQLLKTLITKMSFIKGVKGVAAEKMSEEEKKSIKSAIPAARSRAFNMLFALFGDTPMIKQQFRITEDQDVEKVKNNLRKITAHIMSLKEQQFLLDEDGSLAFNRAGAVNNGVGSASTIKFSKFWLGHSADQRAAELIHEASHGTEGLATKDLAYLGTWADAIIKGGSAIINAPTYERAVLVKGAEKSGEEKPTEKKLDITEIQIVHKDKFVNILGKIDFHTTQAWWFANNISGFANKIPADEDLKKDKIETGYTWKLFCAKHRWVAQICVQLGSPVSKIQSNRTMFTAVDHEMIKLYVRCLADLKDAVHALDKINVLNAKPDKTINKNEINFLAADINNEGEMIQTWIVKELAGELKLPKSITGDDFYDRIKKASGLKDKVEPGVDKSGI